MNRVNQDLLVRYSQGKCSPEEAAMVEEWLSGKNFDQDPDSLTWNTARKDQVKSEILSRLKKDIAPPSPTPVQPQKKPIWYWAACILILCGTLSTWWIRSGKVLPGNASDSFPPPAVSKIEVENGEKEKLTLFDGSTIELNGGSSLAFSKQLVQNNRSVTLEHGEAFFDIIKDSQHPFWVHLGDSRIEVTGTRFNIRYDRPDSGFAITLTSGSIRFRDSSGRLTELAPGEKLTYHPGTRTLQIAKTDTSQVIGWRYNTLKFDDHPLNQVLLDLERAFGTTFLVAPDVKSDLPVTASFKQEPLDRILRTLGLSMDLSFHQKGDSWHVENVSASRR